MYGRVVGLPLFTGISSTDLLEFQDRFMLSIEPINAGTRLLTQGGRSEGLLWIVSGTVRRCNEWMEETVEGPILVEPERLFGLNNTVGMTWDAVTTLEVIYISKEHVVKHLLRNSIVRINYLTLLSSLLQRKDKAADVPRSPEEKFRMLVRSMRHQNSKELTLHIKMTELAERLDISRLNLSRMLNRLAENGEIEMKREQITIHG